MNKTRKQLENSRSRKLLGWILGQMIIPAAAVVGTWIIALVWNVDRAFGLTFSSADLLIISALLFIAITIELYCDSRERQNPIDDLKLDVNFLLSFGLSALFIAAYVAIKCFALKQNEFLEMYGWVSIGSGTLAFILAFTIITSTYKRFLEEDIAALAGE